MDVKKCLTEKASQINGLDVTSMQFPDCEIDVEKIKVIMINEVQPKNEDDGFYSKTEEPDYVKSTVSIFNGADVNVNNMSDILDLGIYITTAVKTPKSGLYVDGEVLKAHLPILEAEINLFPNLKVIMLMGDVAKKAVNMIVKAKTKKNVIPSGATYKLRLNEYFWGDIRVFPSYILTGKNLLIEKGKSSMTSDDIRQMMDLLR